eukprot:TRINITY_DN32741_c0_g1_i1.p1 TRINITY_DN32741_c0_g1~~TRINITY_DN32741_c0_g1_i1.p1  ORF type:complete len:551 (+),score=211.01 TRINITY_DN32741_c0_g1_i1:65-1654(+)
MAKAPGASYDSPKSDLAICTAEPYAQGRLSIVVLGASGDLAKKKTYPALLDLFSNGFLPKGVAIVGYARSAKSDEDFRSGIKPFLMKTKDADEGKVDAFLGTCTYHQGNYDKPEDFAKLHARLEEVEAASGREGDANRLFYFAIPPNAFLPSARSIKEAALSTSGFNRLIVEKPFGHDLESAQRLAADLGAIFSEDHIYRIDHYLGKEIVQNLIMFRFGNMFLEPLFNHRYVETVRITFKENFGTEGRGGYFTNYGIIRDVMQNHLMQVLSLVAMEPPPRLTGEGAGNMIRNAKVQVLQSISPINPRDVVIGQYAESKDGKPAFLDDPSIAAEDREKARLCPTFAMMALQVNTPRWEGVPFIMKAGKALEERKAEIRIQFKDAPASSFMFGGHQLARNELVMVLQPSEAVYMKVNVKQPGLSFDPAQSELDLTYRQRYKGTYNPDAYTRLVLEALRGNQSTFVRSDELEAAWRIFDPLLTALEKGHGSEPPRVPLKYEYGSRGPAEADELLVEKGFKFESGYTWSESKM